MTNHVAPGFGPLELELLEDREQSAVRAHLDTCPKCSEEYRLSSEALASLALSLPRTTPSPDVRHRLLRSVSIANRFESFAAQVAALIDVGIDKARELLARIDDAKVWSTTPLDGVLSYDLPVGPAAADAVVGFVRITPGHFFPDHEHMGDESMLVLQGGVLDSNSGAKVRRGELLLMTQGTRHQLTALPGPDLIYLGVAHQGFLMFGQHFKPGDRRV